MRLKRLLKEELRNLYSAANIIRRIKSRRIRWTRHVVCMGGKCSAYKIMMGKLEGKRPLRRPRCRWKEMLNCIVKK
jgi:hypothetical protein